MTITAQRQQALDFSLPYFDANQHARANGYITASFRDLAALQQALATEQVDAAIDDLPVVAAYVRHNPGNFEVLAQLRPGSGTDTRSRRPARPLIT